MSDTLEMALPGTDNALTEGFWGLKALRQVGLMLGLAASVALGVAVVLWAQGKDYQPLAGGLERGDMVGIAKVLEQNEIGYKVDTSSGAVLVDASQLERARMKLAEAGITPERGFGFEILEKEQPLGSSQFMENARYLRSLEGELARTITSIHSVRNARVHIAIPKSSVFLRDKRDVHASVLVDRSGRDLDAGQVKAIASLVSASVPDLPLANVTVIDQTGKLLSEDYSNPELTLANQQRDHQRAYEDQLAKRIESILLPILGTDKFRAEVSADMDFSQVEQADEIFNPDAPAVRSEQTVEEKSGSGANPGGIPGALSNQPPASGAAPEVVNGQTNAAAPKGSSASASSGNARSQAARNFELDRTVSYTKHQMGRLVRLSVAVVVDDQMKAGADGKTQRTPWTDAELERVATLVRNAVGFSAARGDSVTVVNNAFVERKEPEIEAMKPWEQPWVRDMMRPVVSGLVVLALVFGVLRPVLNKLADNSKRIQELQQQNEMALLGMPGGVGELAGRVDANGMPMMMGNGATFMLPSPEESYEQQLTAVKGLIAQDSERVAQVIKQWVNDEQ